MTKCRLSVAILLFAEWRPASCFQLLLVPRARKRSGRDVKSLVKSSPLNGETRVAIVPPSEKGQSWHADAIHHLNEIAIQLDIPFISGSNDSASYSHLLTTVSYPSANSYALGLHANPQQSSRRRTKSNLKLDPMFVDLCPPSNTRLGYRINQKDAAGGEELLLKALGIKKMIADKQLHSDEPLIVYDLTAGLARDSLIIMNACIRNIDDQETPSIKLHMIERDKIVATLVLDAMRRLRLLAKLDAAIPSELNTGHARQLIRSLTMQDGDAIEVLQSMFTDQCKLTSLYPPDICYLDPMFPPRKKKSSAVKKDMSILHSLLRTANKTDDNIQSEKSRIEQERNLLRVAYKSATKRVVVKRPIGAPPLGCLDTSGDNSIASPSFDIRGKLNRWDIYLISQRSEN